jgi:hypothetical protein
MTKDEAIRILDQAREGRLFLPATIRQALILSGDLESLDPYGRDERLEKAYLVQSARIREPSAWSLDGYTKRLFAGNRTCQ